jgi:hypothetical protein
MGSTVSLVTSGGMPILLYRLMLQDGQAIASALLSQPASAARLCSIPAATAFRTLHGRNPSEISAMPESTHIGSGGGGGIRTHETVARLPVFKTGAFNRSATPPEGAAGVRQRSLRSRARYSIDPFCLKGLHFDHLITYMSSS